MNCVQGILKDNLEKMSGNNIVMSYDMSRHAHDRQTSCKYQDMPPWLLKVCWQHGMLRSRTKNRRLVTSSLLGGLLEVNWSVVCAACCHMALVFAVMHLCHIFISFFYCFGPFPFFFKFTFF